MADSTKQWFTVEGFYTGFFGFTVQATNREEAERLFWDTSMEDERVEHEMDMLEVTGVVEQSSGVTTNTN